MSTISTDSYSDVGNDKYYIKGGYCRINVGDMFNERYRAVYLLGWGKYSMVWLVWDYKDLVFRAMKGIRCSDNANDVAEDEIEFNQQIDDHTHICKLIDTFIINGGNDCHRFLVFECLGVGLDFIVHHHRRLPIPIVESIVQSMLKGVTHLKKKSIIHTDIKLANVLVSKVPYHIQKIMATYKPPPINTIISTPFVKGEITYVPYTDEELMNVKLADLGNAYYDDDISSFHVQSDEMMAPEVILGYNYDQAIDVWSIGCVAYELLTGRPLFDCAGGSMDSNDDFISYNENHLACVEELLGPMPKYIIREGIYSSRYIDITTDKYKHIDQLVSQSLTDKLSDLDIWDTDEDISRICNLLLPLLALNPKKRLECIA